MCHLYYPSCRTCLLPGILHPGRRCQDLHLLANVADILFSGPLPRQTYLSSFDQGHHLVPFTRLKFSWWSYLLHQMVFPLTHQLPIRQHAYHQHRSWKIYPTKIYLQLLPVLLNLASIRWSVTFTLSFIRVAMLLPFSPYGLAYAALYSFFPVCLLVYYDTLKKIPNLATFLCQTQYRFPCSSLSASSPSAPDPQIPSWISLPSRLVIAQP